MASAQGHEGWNLQRMDTKMTLDNYEDDENNNDSGDKLEHNAKMDDHLHPTAKHEQSLRRFKL
jgi:hypothetical protein